VSSRRPSAASTSSRALAAVGGFALAASLGLLPANAAPTTSSLTTIGKAAAAQPTITKQPTSITRYSTKTATFTVKATGATSYRWQTLKKSTRTPISKATTSSYQLRVTASLNGASYRVVVTNKTGSVMSKTAKLTVKAWPGSGNPKDPFIVNHTFASGDWTFNFGVLNTNAWSTIKAAKLGGPAPKKGYSYMMAKLTLTKNRKKALDPRDQTALLIASDTSGYYDNCGKLPSDFAAKLGVLKAGQTRSGNVCISVKPSDLSTALWTVIGATDAGGAGDFDSVKLH